MIPGTRIGVYQLIAKLGEGGMGEVYRARDTRLGREVALKILPASFASDSERLRRFELEARTLASLNHPHIAQIYGVEDRALVMELVEGEELAERLGRGPLSVVEILPLAKQIVDALEAAHSAGVVHRDLKPANIKVRPDGTVKLLDFGIAKALTLSDSKTELAIAATQDGRVIGTAPYMSPEQARGELVDRRTDIWAFGCVVFEMLTAQRVFAGATAADTVAAILEREPNWQQLPPRTPPAWQRLLRRCLAKDKRHRLADIADARFDLEDTSMPHPGPSRTKSLSWWHLAAAALGAAAIATAMVYLLRPPATIDRTVTRAVILPPSGDRLVGHGTRSVAISPDGGRLIVVTDGGLYQRSLNTMEIRRVVAASGSAGGNVTFSPDGNRVAIIGVRGVRTVDLATAALAELPPPNLADLAGILPTVSWNAHGLLAALGAGGIWLFDENRSEWRQLVQLLAGETTSSGQLLPDGKHVLMTVIPPGDHLATSRAQVVVQAAGTTERTVIAEHGADARYTSNGFITYVDDGILYAVPFDAAVRRTTGPRIPAVRGIQPANIFNATMQYAVADNGTLVYVPGQAAPAATALDLVITTRDGGVEQLHLPPGPYEAPRISPDGRRLAVSTDDGKDAGVWVKDLTDASALRRFTLDGRSRLPVWSADGRRLAYQTEREGDIAVFWQAADGSDTPTRLTRPQGGAVHAPEAMSATHLLYIETRDRRVTLWALSLADGRAAPFGGVSGSTPTAAVFSPDGKWVAYQVRAATSLYAVYVQPFPATGAIYQVSHNDDGHHPVWSRDGRELIYSPGPRQLMAVRLQLPKFSIGPPTVFAPAGLMGPGLVPRHYDLLDSQRFIGRYVAVDDDTRAGAPPRIHIVTNWFNELDRPGSSGKLLGQRHPPLSSRIVAPWFDAVHFAIPHVVRLQFPVASR